MTTDSNQTIAARTIHRSRAVPSGIPASGCSTKPDSITAALPVSDGRRRSRACHREIPSAAAKGASNEKAEGHPWKSHLLHPVRQFGKRAAEFFSPSAEAAATTEAYEIVLEQPGISEDQVHLEVHDDRLAVTGEKRARSEESGRTYLVSPSAPTAASARTDRLPGDADVDKVSAVHKDGVLSIVIPNLASRCPKAGRSPSAAAGRYSGRGRPRLRGPSLLLGAAASTGRG